MTTLIIHNNKKKSKLIASFATELGGKVIEISEDITEEIALGKYMNNIKTNELASKESVLNKLRKNDNLIWQIVYRFFRYYSWFKITF